MLDTCWITQSSACQEIVRMSYGYDYEVQRTDMEEMIIGLLEKERGGGGGAETRSQQSSG